MLTGQATHLQEVGHHLTALHTTWTATRIATQQAQEPEPIFQQIDATLAAIVAAQTPLETQRVAVLDLQSRVSHEVPRCEQALVQIAQVQQQAVTGMLVRDGLPLWRAALWTEARTALPEHVRQVAIAYWSDILRYVRDPAAGLPLHVGLFLGKVSRLGADDNAFAYDYHSTFVNSGLNLNMALALFPFTAYGGGLVILPWEGAVFTVAALDPSGTATNNDLGDAFQDGVLVTAEGRVTIKPFGLVGHQLLGGGWSNKEHVSLEQDPSNIARSLLTQQFPRLADPGPFLTRLLERFFPSLLVPTQPLNRVSDTWTVYYNFDQYLWSPAGHPDRGIGLFFRFGVSDGVANPIKYAYNVGIGGKGLVPGRPSDTFGLGWARTEFSGNFVPFLRQELRLGLGHEDAIEMYYNAVLTPWLSAALDLQIIDPALNRTLDASGVQLRDMNTAVVLGLRIYSRF